LLPIRRILPQSLPAFIAHGAATGGLRVDSHFPYTPCHIPVATPHFHAPPAARVAGTCLTYQICSYAYPCATQHVN